MLPWLCVGGGVWKWRRSIALVTRTKMGGHKLTEREQPAPKSAWPPFTRHPPTRPLFAHCLIYVHSGRCAHHLFNPLSGGRHAQPHASNYAYPSASPLPPSTFHVSCCTRMHAMCGRGGCQVRECNPTLYTRMKYVWMERRGGEVFVTVYTRKHTRPSKSAALSLSCY